MSLRVVIVTIEEPFYTPRVVEGLLRLRASEIAFIVALPPAAGKRTILTIAREHLALYGLFGFLAKSASFAWRRCVDRLAVWLFTICSYSVRHVAKRWRIPCITPNSINDPHFLATLRGIAPDVVLSLGLPQIFRRELLAIPRLGCINVHNGPLPRYRGMLPSFWVLYHGEHETAVTVHFMDEKLDNGPILMRRTVPILPGDSQDSLLRRTKGLGPEVVDEALERLNCGEMETIANDAAEASHFSFPTAADARRFREMGRRFR